MEGRSLASFALSDAYATGFLISGLLMGLVDPRKAGRWALTLGIISLAATVGYIIVKVIEDPQVGPGNLWPILLGISVLYGLVPAALGAYCAKFGRWALQRLGLR